MGIRRDASDEEGSDSAVLGIASGDVAINNENSKRSADFFSISISVLASRGVNVFQSWPLDSRTMLPEPPCHVNRDPKKGCGCIPVKGRPRRRLCIKTPHGEKVGLFRPFEREDL
jgi:hypothetical protein